MKVSSNIASSFSRAFNTNAFGAGIAVPTTSPNAQALSGIKAKRNAHGIARAGNVISFCTEQPSQAYTLWIWSEKWFELTGNGWVKNGAVAAEYTKTVDPGAKASFTTTEDDLIFIQAATTPCQYLLLAGTSRYADSAFTDYVFKFS